MPKSTTIPVNIYEPILQNLFLQECGTENWNDLLNFVCSTLHKEVQEAYLRAVQMDTQEIDAELQVSALITFISFI